MKLKTSFVFLGGLVVGMLFSIPDAPAHEESECDCPVCPEPPPCPPCVEIEGPFIEEPVLTIIQGAKPAHPDQKKVQEALEAIEKAEEFEAEQSKE